MTEKARWYMFIKINKDLTGLNTATPTTSIMISSLFFVNNLFLGIGMDYWEAPMVVVSCQHFDYKPNFKKM